MQFAIQRSFHKNSTLAVAKIAKPALQRRKGGDHPHRAAQEVKNEEDSYEQRYFENRFGAFCVKVFERMKAEHQRELASLNPRRNPWADNF